MKKTVILFLLISVLAMTFCTASYASDTYTFFDIYNTNIPEDNISSKNVAYVGGVYYMNGRSDGLFYSHDAVSWHFIDGSYGARIISDGKTKSDALIIFYNGYIAKSTDGANFTLLHKFLPNTVIHFTNGLYVAYEKSDNGANIYASYDAQNWIEVCGNVINGQFKTDRYNDKYIINNISTSSGSVCALITDTAQIYPYSHITYDEQKGIYAMIKNDTDIPVISYASSLSEESIKVSLPEDIKVNNVSYYDGAFYAAYFNSDKLEAVKRCIDMQNWEWFSTYYTPLFSTQDKNGNLQQIYLWNNSDNNTKGAVIKTTKNSTPIYNSIILANDLKLGLYGPVYGIATDSAATNLISTDGTVWQQANDASGFSILNSHSQRGSFMFIDHTSNHTIYKPKGNPYQGLDAQGVEVRLNGHFIAFDQPPVIINDRTLVPIRAIAESLGAVVEYDAQTKKITMSLGGNTITMHIGSTEANIQYYDGASYSPSLDSAPVIINDRTLVPVRFISEAFNKNVEWESGAKTVWINEK